MNPDRRRKLAGSAMVGLGCLQAVWGAVQGDAVFSLFGLAYASLGAAYLRFEVYAGGQ